MIHYNFLYYDSVDSTNNEIKRLSNEGYPEGTVVVANTQTAGKGRLGRRWVSPRGNLYFTILLKPKVPLDTLSQLSLVAGLALGKTINYYLGKPHGAALKWPNDILINEQKVAGVLIETDMAVCQLDECPCFLGIGVNLTSSPEFTAYPAACLQDFMEKAPNGEELLENFTMNFNSMYITWQESSFESLKDEWLDLAYGLGKLAVATSQKEGQVAGEFLTITSDGAIVIRDENDKEHIISSSEVTFTQF